MFSKKYESLDSWNILKFFIIKNKFRIEFEYLKTQILIL
jgi:hypothetical protein